MTIDERFDARHRDFLLRNIEVISDILEALYGSPDHGNKQDPMDELIYIHLSKKTSEKGYVEAFDRLSAAFPEWKGLAEADHGHVKSLIASAGLGETRTRELLSNMKKVKGKFGRETLDPIKEWPDRKIFKFLIGLDGIGPKSARCIMMYSLGRRVFPVDTHVHTVCERMGFIESGLNHKIAQEELAEMFPKKYRYSLHVNMVAHGREICRERGKPLCRECHLKKFCLYFRKTAKKNGKGIPMVDLFCGAGGGSRGFTDAGFEVKFAVDNNIAATDTYYLNHPELSFDEVLDGDIRGLDKELLKETVKEKIVLLFGGPPCQGWSNIGKNRKKNGNKEWDFLKDERNKLYLEFLRGLDALKPRYFVMENVPGLMAAHDGKYADIIQNAFDVHGYVSVMVKLNARDYGVAQNRIRVFFLGRRVCEKERRDVAEGELRAIIGSIEGRATSKCVSFRERVKGLPHLEPGEGANVLRVDGMGLQGEPEQESKFERLLVFNHFARRHNPRDLEIYSLLDEGEDYGSFCDRIGRDDLKPYSDESFRTKYRKIKGNYPCYTIISHLSRDANSYIHPDDNRGITVREAARIQSFPDDFIFLEKGFKQFILVGDAVPPRLARVIGEAVIEIVKGKKPWVETESW